MVILNGPKLRELRRARKETQAALAAAADTSDRYIRDLEKGIKKDPSASIVYGCAGFLGVAMEDLMTVSEEEN